MKGVVLVVVLAGCGRSGFNPMIDGAAHDAPAAPMQVALTLDRQAPGETLVDFPLPVKLDAAHLAGTPHFKDASGSELAFEIEDAGPPLLAWVRVPQIAGSTTAITAVFDGTTPSVTNPWDASYEGVWHMGSNAGHDSSPHGRDATVMGTAAIAGAVGPGRAFSLAAADGLIVPDGASVAFTQITLSGWLLVHSTNMGNMYSAVITRELGNTNDDDFYLGENTGTPYAFIHTDASSNAPNGPVMSLERWYQLSVTYDGTLARFYIDGVEIQNGTASGNVLADATPFDIGCGRNQPTSPPGTCDSDYIDGDLDEVRIESVARSGAWIDFEHAADRDQVITYGPLVAAP